MNQRGSDGQPDERRATGAAQVSTFRRRRLGAALAAVLVTAAVTAVGLSSTHEADAAPLSGITTSIALQDTGGAHGDADPKPFILAGEDATFDVGIRNADPDGDDGFNTAFTVLLPNGIDFVSSGGMGSPIVYPSGATLPNSAKTPPPPLATVPAGMQLWVFEDVADLPNGAVYTSTLTVRPDAGVFPVGAEPRFDLSGYVSSDPAVRPIFDGSTGVGGAAALAETTGAPSSETAAVHALRLTKHEPSPEIELLRGVHDHPTTYTLTVEHTPQGDTGSVVVVDYLPAGLEFLACGTTDNTTAAPQLTADDREYPGAGPLGTAGDPGDCLAPVSVETVNSGLPAGLPPGVYTKVTWELPTLDRGTEQPTNRSAAGVPGVYTIRYRAAVALFENTMDFAGPTPSPTSGHQGANLANNNGPSTRQGQGAGFGDGILYRNHATVTGAYAGPVTSQAARAASDTDTEDVQAMDVRVLKDVDTPNFVTGGLARFTLTLDTGEYTSADRIVLTDTLPNGLCPALPAAPPVLTGDPLPSECALPVAGGAVTGATVLSVDYDAATGEFVVVLEPSRDLTDNDTLVVEYTALMRASYDDHGQWNGPTSSGDSLSNEVELEAWTHSIPDLAGVTGNGPNGGAPAFGDEDVWDDSAADLGSALSSISKRVLQRDAVIPGALSAATSCAVAPAGDWAPELADDGFRLGDVVCYELTVRFAAGIDVRNPKVTDFLPVGVEYVDSTVYTGAGGTSASVNVPAPQVTGQRVQWLVGLPDPAGDRFVPGGSTLVLHVLGRVTSLTPNTSAVLDKPENLMKYQQENVLGDVFFLRDAASVLVEQGVGLVKGVRDVNGAAGRPAATQADADGTVFGSDRDGIQVVQGEQVTYRVDLTAAPYPVTGLVVWDALPTGVAKADVSAISDGGVALNPGDPDYPANLALAGRSVIVWNGLSLAAGVNDTLTYTVTVPVGTAVNTTLPNTASITQFGVGLNTGGSTTYYPDGSLDTTTRPADQVVPGAGTRDDSSVYLPPASITKTRLSTEFGGGTNNGAEHAVQGELITWQYQVTVPAHTTVRNAVLRDRGTLTAGPVPYTVTAGNWSATTGVDTTGFTFAANPAGTAKGVLTFPATYTNTTAAPQVFTVTLTGYVADAGNNNVTLTNQAQFTSDTWSNNATATVVYREPNPQIDKSATPSTGLVGGQTVTYTLTATNPGNSRPTSWDTVVHDCVPAALADVTPVGTPAGVVVGAQGTSCDIAPGTNNGTSITWTIGDLPGAVSPAPSIQYTVTLPPVPAGNEQYTNTATIEGYTLPSTVGGSSTVDRRGRRTHQDTQQLQVAGATIAKSVSPALAPIGDTVTYTVDVALPSNVQFYDTTITDTLPTGVAFVAVTGWTTTGAGAPAQVTPSQSGQVLTWNLGDVPASTEARTVRITFTARLTTGVTAAVPAPNNTVALAWNRVNDDPTTSETRNDDASVTVLNPVLAIEKSVSDPNPDPGETFTYTVRVTNTGNTPAHNMVVEDAVPTGVVVDAATVSNGGAIAGAHAVNGGGTITWNLAGPLSHNAPGNVLTLTYTARLAPSATILDDDTFTNVASVEHYESFPTGGRSYDPTDVRDDATVDPPFPNVVVTKDVTGSTLAAVGAPFSWTITATNTGDGPAQTVTLTDTLPPNWTYTVVQSVTVGGAALTPAPAPTVTGAGTTADPQRLAWTFGAAAPATPALGANGQTIVIVFTATPQQDAVLTPGVTTAGPPVVRPPHTNTVAVAATDTSGATGNESGAYHGPDDDADAFIHAADMQLDKTAGGPLTAGGAAATAWTIVVTNNGPDPAVGPFTVADTWGNAGVLPAGFTVTGVTGTGWGCVTRVDGTGFDCTRSGSLAAGASFAPIVVTAQAAAGFDLASSPVPNRATVDAAGTHDPDPNNDEDTASVPVTALADLQLVKSGSTTANAGGPINWTITVRNNGPSDSLSTAGNLITVTDTIPTGVSGVTLATPLPTGWTATPAGPYAAGDTVTLTLAAGNRLTPNQSTAFTLSGTIASSWPAATPLTNSATVAPGITPEPANPGTTNNTDDHTVTPTIATTLGIAKVRVVFDGTDWVPANSLVPVPPPVPGDPVTYLVTVANTGTADARNVTVTDDVEPSLAYTGLDSVVGTWTRTAGPAGPGDDQTFTLTGDLAAGASASFRVTFTLDPAHTGDVENTVTARADNSTNTPNDSDSTGSDRSADLTIGKTHTGSAVAGSTLAYTLTVTNLGPSDSSGPIVITDTLPAGFGFQTGSATASIAGAAAVPLAPAMAGQDLTWTIGDGDPGFVLADGATIVISFTATIAPDVVAGSHVNSAAVDGPDDDDPTNNDDDDPAQVETEADLSIVKTADAGPYVAGDTVGYAIEVTNVGPSVARGVAVVDTPPAGMTISAMSATGPTAADWTCDVATATCTIAILPIGTVTIDVTATIAPSVPDGTDLTNVATVTSPTPDPTPDDRTDDETVPVTTSADLVLAKTAVDADGTTAITTAAAGAQVRYRLEVTNVGPSDAVGPLEIVDTLPAGFRYVGIAAGAAAWTCAVDPTDAQIVTCTNPSGLARGGAAEPLVAIVAIDPAQPTGAFDNTATVSSPTPDPTPPNNTDDAPIEVTHDADLSIVKTHDPAAVRIGGTFAFDLDVRNLGPTRATSVTVVDTLPAGLEYVDATGSDARWTVVAAPVAADGTTTVTATLAGEVAPGAAAPPLRITVMVHPAAYATVTNVAGVSSDQPDSHPDDNTTHDPVTVPPLSALVLTKTAVGAFQVGSAARYDLVVTNRGPTEDPGPIVVTDDLPAGLTFRSASGGATCVAEGSVVRCTIAGPLAVGASVTVTLTVDVDAKAYPQVTNTAVATSPTSQTADADLSDDATVTVAAAPTMPSTGSGTTGPVLAFAMLLLVLGGTLLGTTRRRRVAPDA